MEQARKKTEVAVVEDDNLPTATANQLPAHLRTENKRGSEVLTSEDIEVAWLKLLQATSPGIHENNWTAGRFLHSVTELEIETDEENEDFVRPLDLVVIQILQPVYVLFRPLDQGGGILAKADDGVHWHPKNEKFEIKIGKRTVIWETTPTVKEGDLWRWGSSDPEDSESPPAADLQYRYICVSPSYPELGPFMVVLQRSGLQAARRLNAFLDNQECDSFGCVFRISSKWEDKGPDNKKFIWRFKPNGYVADPDEFARYEAIYERYKDRDVKVHDEESMVSDTDDTATGDGDKEESTEY